MTTSDVPRVLVVDGGPGQSRSALAAVRALGEAGLDPYVTVSGPGSLAASSRHAVGCIRVPAVHHPTFVEVVRPLMEGERFEATMVASDAAIIALGLPESELVDKSRLHGRAVDAGLAVPDGRRFAAPEDVMDAAPDLPYPVVVKPAIKTGPVSVPARVARRREELPGALEDRAGPLIVQVRLDGALRSVSGVIRRGRAIAWAHQRYIRTWPRDAGVSCFAETVDPDRRLEVKIERLLGDHEGIFQVQLAGEHVLDVNPRVYGSLPLAVAAGVNLPAIHCLARLAGDAPGPQRARPGVRYRWIEGDLRHVAQGILAGEIGPYAAWEALRPRRRTVHSVARLSDPGPALARLAHVATTLWEEADRRG